MTTTTAATIATRTLVGVVGSDNVSLTGGTATFANKSVANGKYLVASDGVAHNQWLYCKEGTPLDWIQVGPDDNASFRLATAPLFLSYTESTGAVKLWQTAFQAQYRRQPATTGESIFNLHWDNYMWLSKQSPYITRSGNPKNADAQWRIERVTPSK